LRSNNFPLKFQRYLAPAVAGRFFMRENTEPAEEKASRQSLRKAQPNYQLPITNYQLSDLHF
jgi:hypothetical protein